ncbi:MAG TPA: diaminopimelate decarboxylase [Stellaceae bacterium]|nr:diaminopimelate decarboxylase [Stellaceae bacterium]
MISDDGFHYRDGRLQGEGVDLAALAEEIGTPFYCYSSAVIARQYRRLAEVLPGRVCYAVKANTNQAVIATLAQLGAGADVVSEGEARRALAAGVAPKDIVFSGVGRTARELVFAIEAGIGQVNLESERDLKLLSDLASARGKTMRIAIRVNPDVDARTHAKISTGKAENKFGIDIGSVARIYREAADMPGIDASAIAMHIGSQLLDLAPYRMAFAKLATLVREIRGQGVDIRHLDLGGGIGIPYMGEKPPELAEYAAIIAETLGDLGCDYTFEPGRFLVAEAGVIVSRIIDVKQGATKRFVVQDAAMTELMRPTLYNANHPILPVAQPKPGTGSAKADIVGPVCETGDYLAVDREMPNVAPGDLLATGMAGAYGAVMGSTYNTRPLAPEILLKGSDWAVIRPRQTYEELLALDRLPVWLGSGRG